jgi:hypothetical protein
MKKVDNYLVFLRTNRQKASDLFRNIQKNLLDNSGLSVSMEKIKKILFLLPNAYAYTRDRGDHTDIRLSLPYGQVCVDKRASDLKKSMEEFIQTAIK